MRTIGQYAHKDLITYYTRGKLRAERNPNFVHLIRKKRGLKIIKGHKKIVKESS
jgi:hypothetical protein